MKHLFAALSICVATSTQYSEALSFSTQVPESKTTVSPDFSIIHIDHARKYIEEIYPMALAIQQKHRIPAPITMAIACLESGYGRSYYAQKRNNHLGIRVYKNGKADYRKFSSTQACFDYYSNMFDNERYLPLQEIEGDDLFTWIDKLASCGFNHRSHYSKKIMTMIQFIHLDKLDYPPIA